ncbi:hypothetical protein [Mycoplasma procyoni]|uniref:hypothetical protein n=1 Tax=Mycoplasma procyoni TaxID=568784 RepID=UPI00197B0E7F|nr:hypothetical protein [Mycoplasma procyoni]MBN3534520.1 hypothetical protein [Mycoplasma procyoni]
MWSFPSLKTLKSLAITLLVFSAIAVGKEILFWLLVTFSAISFQSNSTSVNEAVTTGLAISFGIVLYLLFWLFGAIAILVISIIAFVKFLEAHKENLLMELYGLWIATLVLSILFLVLGWIPIIKVFFLIVPIITASLTISKINKLLV